jgi:hypothetical protein
MLGFKDVAEILTRIFVVVYNVEERPGSWTVGLLAVGARLLDADVA